MVRRRLNTNNHANSGLNYLIFLSKWFIILNTTLWLVIIVVIKISELRSDYTDSATDGFILLVSMAAGFVYGNKIQKYLDRMGYFKLYNLALLIGYVHLFLNYIDYPNLNWLRKRT